MKFSLQRSLLPGLTATLLAFSLGSTAQAANITWGAATTIKNDLDVLNTGTQVGAFNIGRTGVPITTVNSVTFDPFAVAVNANSNTVGNFTLGFVSADSTDSAFGSGSAPFSGLSTSYRTLLQSGAVDFGNGPITLTMNGLTSGTNYSFQWWANDSSNLYNSTGMTATAVATNGNARTLDSNTTNASGGVGQFAIGTFTADSTSQVVTFTNAGGSLPLLNAFQLRSGVAPVPEPGTYAMMALGIGALGLMTWRRRKNSDSLA